MRWRQTRALTARVLPLLGMTDMAHTPGSAHLLSGEDLHGFQLAGLRIILAGVYAYTAPPRRSAQRGELSR